MESTEIKIGRGSSIAPDLFSYLYEITGNDNFTVQGNFWSTSRLSNYRRGGYKGLCQEGNY